MFAFFTKRSLSQWKSQYEQPESPEEHLQRSDDEFGPVITEEETGRKPEKPAIEEPPSAVSRPARVAGFRLTPERIREGIIISEILKPKFLDD